MDGLSTSVSPLGLPEVTLHPPFTLRPTSSPLCSLLAAITPGAPLNVDKGWDLIGVKCCIPITDFPVVLADALGFL